MKLKIDFSLPKLVKFRIGLQLGLDVGAKVDVRLRLRGREPLRWKAAIARGEGKKPELPEHETVIVPPRELPRA
jgi:hypothetical protein